MAVLQLVVVDGPNQGQEFDITGSYVIGRDPSSGIVLDDPEASRRHAALRPGGDGVVVEDLGSTNGTYLNRRRVTSPVELQRGDQVKIGKTVMELRK